MLMRDEASAVNRIADRIERKMAEEIGYRSDLHFADYRMAGSDMATVGIGYTPHCGNPTSDDVERFVIRYFGGKARPHMCTARLHKDVGAVTVCVTRQRACRDVADTEKMAVIGVNRYIDASTKDLWEIEDNEGTPALYRVEGELLEDILKERQARKLVHSSAVRIAKLIDEGSHLAIVGSQVQYLDLTGKEIVGKVMDEPDSDGYLHVQPTNSDATVRVHENQIRELLTTAETDDSTKEKLLRYFEEAFGDSEYAAELVREAQYSGTRDELVAFLTRAGVCDADTAILFTQNLKVGQGKVEKIGPSSLPGLVLAMYNGNGFDWQVDVEEAEKVIQQASAGQDHPAKEGV